MLKLLNALSDAEVLLGSILAHNEEAPGLGVVGVLTDLERIEVSQFGISLFVNLKQLLDEILIIASQLLAILLQV